MKGILITILIFLPIAAFSQADSITVVLFGHYENLDVRISHKKNLIKEINYRKNNIRPGLLLRSSIPKHSKTFEFPLPVDNEMIKNDSILIIVQFKKPWRSKYSSKVIRTDLQPDKRYLIIFRSSKCKRYCFTPEWTNAIPGWD